MIIDLAAGRQQSLSTQQTVVDTPRKFHIAPENRSPPVGK